MLIVPLLCLSAMSLAVDAAESDTAAGPQSTSDQSANVGSGAQAGAAPALQEVVVTAQKREQNLQNVPIAITALTGDDLAERGVSNTLDIASAIPGVVTSAFGENGTSPAIYIRGVGQLDFSPHQESPTALYVDGAYLSFLGATYLGLYDVKQFSVLRGPQGTLFGRNATAGVIQIQTNDPTDYRTGYLQQTFGSFGQTTTEGAISGPLSDKLDARLSFLYNRNGPWFQNISSGASVGSAKSANIRLKLLYKFDEGTKDLFEGFYTRALPMAAGGYLENPSAPNPANHGLSQNTNGPLFASLCNSLGFPTPPPGAGNCQGYVPPGGNPFRLSFQENDPLVGRAASSLWGFTNTFTHKMSWADFTSITNYTSYGTHYIEDDSNNPFPIIGYSESADAYQVSEEARLNGQAASAHWVVGVYALHILGDYTNLTPLYTGVVAPPPAPFTFFNQFSNINGYSILAGSQFPQGVWTEALFGQVDYPLSKRWAVTVGARAEHDVKYADMTQFCDLVIPADTTCAANFLITGSQFAHGNVNQNAWSGNLTFNYQWTDDTLLYAGVRRGTKGSEIDTNTFPGTPGLTFSSIFVEPEILTDIEGGFKSELFNHHLRLNADAFYYIYHNYQAEKFINFADITFNADATDYGGEFSVDALITPTLTASVGFAYLHTRVTNVELPDGTFADQVQPLAPNISLTADLKKVWRVPFGTFFAAGNLTYVGSRYFGSVNQPELLAPRYAQGNLSAGYDTPDGKWDFTLAVKNISNAVILEDAFDVVSSGGYTEYNIAPPRWVSFSVRYTF